jgi:hypothetical protein
MSAMKPNTRAHVAAVPLDGAGCHTMHRWDLGSSRERPKSAGQPTGSAAPLLNATR